MATPLPPSPLLLLLLLLLLITSVSGGPNSTTNSQELSSALEALRNRGYTLFSNAVTTSDLQYQILTRGALSFTLLAPKDEMLYALDMATDAAVYVNNLRYHVIPNHLYTFDNLQNLSSPFLDTLLPHYAILVGKVQDGEVSSEVGVMVDGVRVSTPDLFLGSRIAVHGIDGILLSGLNMNQDPDGGANRSATFPTVESPAPVGNIPAEEMFQFDRDHTDGGTPAPVEGTLTPPSRNNVAVAPASANIPADRTSTPVNHHFDWHDVPAALESPLDPKIRQDQMKKLKSLAKKKREKHHRKGRRGHHHHRKHRSDL